MDLHSQVKGKDENYANPGEYLGAFCFYFKYDYYLGEAFIM